MPPSIHGPSALLPNTLKELCSSILPRLRLIPELKQWLETTAPEKHTPFHTVDPVKWLWNCFSQGAPLLTLLDLLGPKTGACLFNPPPFSAGEGPYSGEANSTLISEFLRRVELLEAQGYLNYGEVFTVNELLDGSCSGFTKVVRMVQRVLNCLEATHPSLYELPERKKFGKVVLTFQRVRNGEVEYLADLNKMADCVAMLERLITPLPITLERLVMYLQRIISYQKHITDYLGNRNIKSTDSVVWDELFALKTVFEITHPIEAPSAFKSLCRAHLRFLNLSETLLELSRYTRTAHALRIINQRAFFWNGPNPETIGELLLDDCVSAEVNGSELGEENSTNTSGPVAETIPHFYAFLFEQALLLCGPPDCEEATQASKSLSPLSDAHCQYPIEPWDLGPALRSNGSLSVLCSIPLLDIAHIHRSASGELWLSIEWEQNGVLHTLTLHCYEYRQFEQWTSVLSSISPDDTISIFTENDEELSPDASPSDEAASVPWHDELDFFKRRVGSKPKPWSLIARKEGTPSSSLYRFTSGSESSLLNMIGSPILRTHPPEMPASPRSISPIQSLQSISIEEAVFPFPGAASVPEIDHDSVLDLTGKIVRTGNYPAAHGGFADVWKCEWIVGGDCHKVAVKVIRGRINNAEREDKMAKRLQRELKVWQHLDHENVIPLYGTCLDFGHYLSLVCPWYENGSMHNYLIKRGDELQLHDRLKFLSEIASGLAYLHSFSIVHGDLSSSNVLINGRKQACLCDFGLSTVVEDFMGPSYPSSVLGGAIRWAAPELFCAPDRDQPYIPQLSMSSDVYSYGSLTLEILSGKVPYHYLKHDGQVLIELSKRIKPERTASPFITNELWKFIGQCWHDSPSARPSTVDISAQISQLRQRTLSRHTI
ncbi:hypothetical protein M0805_004516 [Coniferiporia weirii]|nr:hypothetical protein M0805_004516 [Coniferiporia weirii]